MIMLPMLVFWRPKPWTLRKYMNRAGVHRQLCCWKHPLDYPGIKTVHLHRLLCEHCTGGASLLHLLGFSQFPAFHRQERGNWMCRLLQEIFGTEPFCDSSTSASLTNDKTRICIFFVSLLLRADNYTQQHCLVSTSTLKSK